MSSPVIDMEIIIVNDVVKQIMADMAMRELIAARVESIRQAHANNLIEGLDMGDDALQAMLQRAREPVSNEEFTRREQAIWLEECKQAVKQCRQRDVNMAD